MIQVETDNGLKTYETIEAFIDCMNEELANRKWYKKAADWLRYIVWGKIEDAYYCVKNYFINLHRFRHQLCHFYPWDIHYGIDMFNFCLGELSDYLENHGHEVDESRMKKVAVIKELRQLIDDLSNERCYDLALDELYPGYLNKDHKGQMEIFREASIDKVDKIRLRIEKQKRDRVFEIIKGQDLKDFKKLNKGKDEYLDKDYVDFCDWFDGTGILSWWD